MAASEVSVLGLGNMGAALARAFHAGGHAVTVWNRTPARSAPLASEGIAVAGSAADAIAASPVVVVILADGAAVDEVLSTDEATAAAAGRTIVNLTSDAPEKAAALERRVRDAGARYVDGRIGSIPEGIATDHSNIIYSGDGEAFAAAEPVLRSLGSDLRYLGPDVRAANGLAVGIHSVFLHGILVGFYEGLAAASRYGVPVADCLPHARKTLAAASELIAHGATQCEAGEYGGDGPTLEVHTSAVERSLGAMRSVGAPDELASAMAVQLRRACDAGHGDDEVAALFDVLRDHGRNGR